MASVRATTTTGATGVPERPRATWGDDLAAALLGTWVVGGLFLDGWAHVNQPGLETVFSPWHAVFYAGFLVDAANLQTFGTSSLLLTLAGYWIGRYGETTGRDRAHAPLLAIAVVTVLYAFGDLGMHYLLGDPVSVRAGLIGALPAQIVLNLVLTVPVYALCRRILTRPGSRPAMEVEFGTN